jgi:hypothetical protein
MLTKKLLAVVFLVAVFSGCETAKGAGQGAIKDIDNTYSHVSTGVQYTANGAKKGTSKAWNAVLGADQWIQENMW